MIICSLSRRVLKVGRQVYNIYILSGSSFAFLGAKPLTEQLENVSKKRDAVANSKETLL